MVKDSVVPSAGGYRWRTCWAGGILAALVFLAVWIPTHRARPLLPTDDLYTHLSVARHLVRGEGFRTDVTYPLSFAFDFARELPQPLIHRQPGFALLLTVPYLAASGYPHRAVDMVRHLQIILLGLLITTGTAVFLRRGLGAAVPCWLVLLFTNPLLVFAVDWGMIELACSLLLLVLWLRIQGDTADRPGWIDGLLAGALSMMRLDLFWVPILWWISLRRNRSGMILSQASPRRRLGLVVLAWFLVISPWAVRNLLVTGRPAFSLQTYAEHVKDTRAWPGYTVYRQLEPQPLLKTMTSDPVPVLRKVGRGMKFFRRDLPHLAPLAVLLALACIAVAFLASWLKILPAVFRRGPSSAPVSLVVVTTTLLTIQYSFFDHNLRHLLIILPVLLWEFSFWVGNAIRRWSHRSRAVLILPAVVTLIVVFLFPCRLPGWKNAADEAVRFAPETVRQIESAGQASAGVLFVESSAVPWFIDRPVVWTPTHQEDRSRICTLLGQPEDKP